MNTNKYEIHEAIARNATISFEEPADFNDMSKGSVTITKTCSEIITIGIACEKRIFAERGYPEDKERQSVNSMVLDYIVVNWASIDPEVASTQGEPKMRGTCECRCGNVMFSSVEGIRKVGDCPSCEPEKYDQLQADREEEEAGLSGALLHGEESSESDA